MQTKSWEDKLTAREYEVFLLLPSGKTNAAIAYELGNTAGTVKIHLRSIFRKLGVSTRLEAAVIAARYNSRIRFRPPRDYEAA